MTRWTTRTLGEVATVGAGNSAPQDEALFADGSVPFFRTSDVGRIRFGDIDTATDLLNERGAKGLRRFASGTILFPKSGASTFLNHRVMMKADGCVSSHLATIAARRELAEPRFLLYFLATVQAQDLVQDHAYPSLNLPLIAGIEVPLPPISEQRRLVAILDEAFQAIAMAKANTEKNLQNASEVFEANLQDTFSGAPDGVNPTTLGAVCRFVGGSQPPKSEFVTAPRAGYVRLVQIRDYKSDAKAVYIPRALARRFCAPDDVMIGRYGPPLFQILRGLDGAYNVALMKAAPDESVLSKGYLYYFLRHRDILNYIIASSARAAGQIGLNKETIEPYPIYIPSLRTQAETVTRLEQMEAATKALVRICELKLDALDELKKSLLHQAFTGQLNAKSTDKQLEAVA
jgi:type I restriction enzyme S subunit